MRAEHERLDYVGIHLWPANWGWLEQVAIEATGLDDYNTSAAANASLANALAKAKAYLDTHAAVRAARPTPA